MGGLRNRVVSTGWRPFGLLFLISSAFFLLSFVPVDLAALLSEILTRHGRLLGNLWTAFTGLASVISLGITIWMFRGRSGLGERSDDSPVSSQSIAVRSNEGVINITVGFDRTGDVTIGRAERSHQTKERAPDDENGQ